MPSSRLRLLIAALAVVFFATPIALRAVGVTAHRFENRPLAGPPRLSQGWDAIDQTTRYLVDRMPLREQAVRANTWLSRNIFDTTPRYGRGALAGSGGDRALPFGRPAVRDRPAARQPAGNGEVLEGRDGWLYLRGEIDRTCHPFLPFAEALARWRKLVSIVRASGRRAVLLVTPEKSTVYPEHLPGDFTGKSCVQANRPKLWSLLDHSAGSGVVGLRLPLLAERRRTGELVYLRKDSHWNSVGSLVLVREALARVGQGVQVRPEEVVNRGAAPYQGDLTTLLGAPERDSATQLKIRRARGARRVQGTTMFIRDSYGDRPALLMAPYFADLRQPEWFNSSQAKIANAIAKADTVILQTVEREFTYRASDASLVNPVLFRLLRARLGQRR